jgi:hypothetical protein
MSDDAEARRQRAARLREQIAGLTGKRTDEPATGHDSSEANPEATDPAQRRRPPRVHPMSPRSFIENRMRQLDQDKDKKD